MLTNPKTKYRPFPVVRLPDRQWPEREITAAPMWCSVDLRDGNQALAVPMNISQKLEMFEGLVRCGFKEIEVGFPAASNTEFAFLRRLIEDGRVPEGVTIQVLVQAREDLIERTVESLAGVRRAIVHLYNSTSPAQRRIVFGLEKPEVLKIAVRGTQWVKERLPRLAGSDIRFEYSPESFSATEVEFALEVCEAVSEVWGPTPERPIILNLPDTVEVAMPNVYADQIEWFIRNLRRRDTAIVSLHTHNDRGTGTAATELGLLAGADRVEGTLFGNGERTGNLDIVTVALNLYMNGIHPGLDFSDLNRLREVYERCTGMTVPPRHPYSGELVFTAFSGSHQDAIRKGLRAWEQVTAGGRDAVWDIPYLTIDPGDVGREYREVIRVNSQSGKGGVAYLLESEFGIELPKELQREFGPIANDEVDRLGREVTGAELKAMFWREYVERVQPWQLLGFRTESGAGGVRAEARLLRGGETVDVTGQGNGPIAAFVHALAAGGAPRFEVAEYSERALSYGEEASAIAYVCLRFGDGRQRWGAGVDTNIELAPIRAILSALNRG
ncbi:MAG: 2-isopropylmalate synthase [Verrucomicrobiae bacterium]|nr:2-isopropylmalate synthase [Verrucomicrobiae bacterium]